MKDYRTFGKGRKVAASYSTVSEMAAEIGLKFKENNFFSINASDGYPCQIDVYEDKKGDLFIANTNELLYDNPHVTGTRLAVSGNCYFQKLITNTKKQKS